MPSIEELIPSILRAKLPASLIEEIAERYESLGDKYITEAVSKDGRHVNAMMFTDRIINCREEIVDAVFCILGQVFKDGYYGDQPSDILYDLMVGLIEIYSSLKFLEAEGKYTIAISNP